MNTRREFLSAGACAAGAALAGCVSRRHCVMTPKIDFSWGALMHLGSNMWSDWYADGKYPSSLQEEERMYRDGTLKRPKGQMGIHRNYMSADMNVWRRQIEMLRDEGLNTVWIDVGEAYAYPSHPELWVKGAFDFDSMRAELDFIRSLGMEPVPKLNFSTGHDQWLREYHCMTSSAKYYEVVADVIRDTCEVFGNPRYFHIGFDEEVYVACRSRKVCVMRSGSQWWKDMLYCVDQVERNGARAMLWSDSICAGREEFFKRMPKSVMQIPWYYGKNFSDEMLKWKTEFEKKLDWSIQRNLAASILELANAGYDIMPCTSNWSCDEAADAMLSFCKKRVDPARIKGLFTAPWLKPVAAEDEKFRKGVKLFADAKRKYYS